MRGAILSDEGMYRYALWRDLPDQLEPARPGGKGLKPRVVRDSQTVLFVMLNPSTADAEEDDPTIRRCMGFARDWGYGRLAVANLYAFRATKPVELFDTPVDPVGEQCDVWLEELAAGAAQIIVAWGATGHPFGPDRVKRVTEILKAPLGYSLHCLGFTEQRHPKHPLYVPNGTTPVAWP